MSFLQLRSPRINNTLANPPIGGGGPQTYFSSLTATLSFTGAMSRSSYRTNTGVLSFSGVFTKRFFDSLTGTLSFTGVYSNIARKSLNGVLSFAGAFARRGARTLTATLSFTGVFIKKELRTLTGALSFVGTFTSSSFRYVVLTGALSFTGAMLKRQGKALLATLTPTVSANTTFSFIQNKQNSTASGTSLTVTPNSPLSQGKLVIVNLKHSTVVTNMSVTDDVGNTYYDTGATTSGTFLKQYYGVQVTGGATVITTSWTNASAARITIDEFSGQSSGKIFDQTQTASGTGITATVAGLTVAKGSLITAQVAWSGGTITAGANYTLSNNTSLQATSYRLASESTETAPMNTSSSGSWIQLVGAYLPEVGFVKAISRTNTATLSYTGTFIKTIQHVFTGILSFTGNFTKTLNRVLTGALSFIGALVTTFIGGGILYLQSLTASLGFVGTLIKTPRRIVTGTLSFTGATTRVVAYPLTATLTFAGSLTKRLLHTFTGALSFSGATIRRGTKQLTATLYLWIVANGSIANADFENAPAFTAATNTQSRWIDGTAAGSSTNDTYRWGLASVVGTANAQFDTAEFHSGTTSLKLATISAGANSQVDQYPLGTKVSTYCLPSNNVSYQIKYWMKTNYVSGDSTQGAYLDVVIRSSPGNANADAQGTFVKTTTGWTEYTINVQHPFPWISLSPRIIGSTGAGTLIMEAWFDDITITPLLPTPGFIKRTSKITSGGLSFVGSILKTLAHNFTAALSFMGDIATSLIHTGTLFTQSLTATLSFTGSYIRKPLKALTGVLSFTSGDYSTRVLADSPVGYWRLGETAGTTATDLGSAAKNGTYTGGYTLNKGGLLLGDSNAAVEFNGTSGYVVLSDNSTSVVDNFTITAMIRPTVPQPTGFIFYNGNDLGGWGLAVGDTGGGTGSKLVGLFGSVVWLDSGQTLTSGNTYHVGMVRRNGQIFFYINGREISGATNTPATPVSTRATIGAQLNTSNAPMRYFQGIADEVAVYATALSADKMAAQYSASLSGITKMTNRTQIATVSFVGSLLKSLAHIFTGTLSFIGNLASINTITRALTATLSFTGAVTKTARKSLTGVLTMFVTHTEPVYNGDFENAPTFVAVTTGNNAWIDGTAAGSSTNKLYGWRNGGGGSFAASFDTISPHSGSYSLKVSTTATGSFDEVRNVLGYDTLGSDAYRFAIRPNTAYSFTYWMRTNLTSGDSNDGAYIAFLGADSAGNNITTRNTTKVKTTTGWTLYTYNFTSNSNECYGHFECRIYGHTGAGTLIMDAWFDDIALTPTTTSFIGFTKRTSRTLTAVASFIGSLNKRLVHVFTGSLSFSGSILKRFARTLTGSLSFTGAIIRRITRTLTGVVSFTGAVATIRSFVRALTATLSFTGALTKRYPKNLTGVLSFTGSMLTTAFTRLIRTIPIVLKSFTTRLSPSTNKNTLSMPVDKSKTAMPTQSNKGRMGTDDKKIRLKGN